MGIKSTMTTFLYRILAPVSQMPLNSTWEHLSVISAVYILTYSDAERAAALFKSSS